MVMIVSVVLVHSCALNKHLIITIELMDEEDSYIADQSDTTALD